MRPLKLVGLGALALVGIPIIAIGWPTILGFLAAFRLLGKNLNPTPYDEAAGLGLMFLGFVMNLIYMGVLFAL